MRKRSVAACGVGALLAMALTGCNTNGGGAGSNSGNKAVFGLNIPLFDANEQMITNTGTRTIFAAWNTPVVRMPFRASISDAVELQALNAIKAIGATPLVVVHGAVDPNVTADDTHLLGLIAQVFGSLQVYVEYGNEEDLAGIDAAAYTASWNRVVPILRWLHPTYQFIGPVNFEYNPAYVGYFVGHARPVPDVVSWHEYVCTPAQSTAYCMAHIANWGTHVTYTNFAEAVAIGRTLPFMFTEWNMDPQEDPRYLEPTVIGPWVTAAVQELEKLVPQGLVGAQLYAADSHGGGFQLVDSSNQLTPEGVAFAAAISASG
ncbi:MAG TPA: hypothetical protein VMU14_14390 [Acidimicrobiales bacterium]|nr:hypothetical protein [Acidimicrobiales bacterium]